MAAPSGKARARGFVRRWKTILDGVSSGEKNEQQDTQKFWLDLLENVLGVPSTQLASYVDFEKRVRGRRIDVYVHDHQFLCEQKSVGVDLDKPEARGRRLETPFQQAMWYAQHMTFYDRVRWVMTCNFETFRIYDLGEQVPEESMVEFGLDELPDRLELLSFLTSDSTSRLHKEQELSVAAGAYVVRIYDALAACYRHLDDSKEEQRSLNVVITRVIFLLYAEDADLLHTHQAFGKYCAGNGSQLREKLARLFDTVDTPEGERDEYLEPELAAFPYINGGLFHDRDIIIPRLNDDVTKAIAEASQDFNWKDISGVIFGGVFEGTLNPETRRQGGMHYTSVRNIDRCLDPLFLDELRRKLAIAEGERVAARRKAKLEELHNEIAHITVGDPAMGSGNFLTEAYRQMRELENRIIEDTIADDSGASGQAMMSFGVGAENHGESPVRVTIDHFYGIEINDFAVSVARTALWITEEQMLRRTQEIMPDYDFDFLPLRSLSHLRQADALEEDWESIFPRELTYLVGNPPFIGARNQTKRQKAQVMAVYDGQRNAGNIDYCAAWYMKAARFSLYKRTRCCLVSTNSICQGEQVANIWKPIHDMGVHIDFAHTTFRWANEAAAGDQAHVFVVIVGFSRESVTKELFVHKTPDSDEVVSYPRNINFYLADGPDVFVWSRQTPLCKSAPPIIAGNKPIDGGNYLFSDEERKAFLAKEPGAEKFFRPWLGSKEFLHGYQRWCLWLGDATWADLKDLPLCRDRIRRVKEYRLNSKSAPTRKIADRPTRFHVECMPEGTSVVIPEVSSQRRRYIPMGFIGPEVLCSNKLRLIPNATAYHFGILQSQFHNAWMRQVAGRLKSDYNYSSGVVYNTFVWPRSDDDAKQEVGHAAEGVLSARGKYPDATLADLYDPDNATYFPELIRAHKALDMAVESAYGVDFRGDEQRIVAHLFELYAQAVS